MVSTLYLTCRRLPAYLGWTRTSYAMLSGFLLLLFVMGFIWWPLAEEYLAQIDWSRPWLRQLDWLLIGIFAFMSLLLMARADFRADLPLILVGLAGGLVIESWGTQTELWTYYTLERPPLWIIPAWPIAALSIDRLVRFCDWLVPQRPGSRVIVLLFTAVYWFIFPVFLLLMIAFVWPALNKPLTVLALTLSVLLILTPMNVRLAVLTFLAGAGLGYFLELWGTTRLCWTYYTGETPPLFAVLAHGMAAVAFWRVKLLLTTLSPARSAARFGIDSR
jgi:hypothetical protein